MAADSYWILTQSTIVTIALGHKKFQSTLIKFRLAERDIANCDTLAYKSWPV